MKQTKIKKLIVVLIVFVMMFSNFGYTISAFASTSGFEVIKNSFFQKEEVEFKAYFEENGEQFDEKISDVNQTIKLKMEILPKQDGYLSNAIIKAVTETGDMPNFKIKNIQTYTTDASQELNTENSAEVEENELEENSTQSEEINILTKGKEENYQSSIEIEIEEENILEKDISIDITTEEDNSEYTNEDTTEGEFSMDIVEENSLEEETSENIMNEEENPIEDQTSENITNEEIPTKEDTSIDISEEDVFVDEDKVIEEKVEEKSKEENFDFMSDVQILSDNEISINNVIEDTVYVVELEYIQEENLKVEDLYKEIYLQFSGTFVNSDLETVEITKEEEITVGWNYHKDAEFESEYTQFSPFIVGEKEGTIVENKITLKRDITEEKYLPLKMSILDINVPTLNGELPIEVSVLANKLLATKGEDVGQVTFSDEDWSYNAERGKITIIVKNEKDGNVKNTYGEDEYTIIYKFEDYIEDATSELKRDVFLTVEQYNAKENAIITKEINDYQEINVNVGELLTYDIHSNEEKIEKSIVYANYNSEMAIYEAEYTSYVTLNVLTSDMLEKIKIDASNEVYKDINGNEYKAEGISYKNIKFNYNEIKPLLENGGSIEICNANGDILHVLDNVSVQAEENCLIEINDANGLIIYINNVAVNGNINIEVTKAIHKCNYDKLTFKNFTNLESRITAEVKYMDMDQTIALGEKIAIKEFKESYTRANIYINKEDLTTVQENENIELRVELNNDKVDSDLYVNPSFEFVFPKHIKEVIVESINLLYEDGLRISDFHTYTENDIVKMRIELSGIQTMFSENKITNGTNIVVNLRIKVDEYTPTKRDQIKMYYCNEGVSNYESQTAWTISKLMPEGILKETNGFDATLIKYNAPEGLIAINGIIDYDGNLSEIKSVEEGEKSAQIPMETDARIATMELLALNNTTNDCSDMVMIGRIPFRGNRDVISNEDLGTTTTTPMREFIIADEQNANMATIYYSSNENATKDLENPENNWVLQEQVEDINAIRSYLIVVDGAVTEETVLRYTYQFEIPENLPYEVSIAGSFGIYYNNHSDIAIVYESASADKITLKTEVGPKVEAVLSVDIGDGTTVGEKKFLNYTLTVKNIGSIVAQNVKVTNQIPQYTTLYEYSNYADAENDGYNSSSKTELEWSISEIQPGAECIYEYMVKTTYIPSFESYCSSKGMKKDEIGYYSEELDEQGNIIKKYVDENYEIFIENTATVSIENLAIEIVSNTTRNKLVDSCFNINISKSFIKETKVGDNPTFNIGVQNITEQPLNNVIMEMFLPENIEYKKAEVNSSINPEFTSTINYDKGTRKLEIVCDTLESYEGINIRLNIEVVKGNLETLKINANFTTETGITESSFVDILCLGANLEVEQTTNLTQNSVKEREQVEFFITVRNTGNELAKNIKIESKISENLENVIANITGDVNTQIQVEGNRLDTTLFGLDKNKKMVLKISGIAKDLDETKTPKEILNKVKITADYVDPIETQEVGVTIYENPNKVDEKPEITPLPDDDEPQIDNSTEPEVPEENPEEERNEEQNQGSSEKTEENLPANEPEEQPKEEQQPVVNTPSVQEEKKYRITGKAWLDSNENGRLDENEELLTGIKVQLLKSDNMIKATSTDGNGDYEFTNLSKGAYKVIFIYDGEVYVATSYKYANVADSVNSKAIESEKGKALTNSINIADSDILDMNLGLVKRKIFNLSIDKYITKAIVKTDKKESEHRYNDLKLGKLEIKAKELENAQVTLEYTILIKNDGEIAGKATKIVDYIPKGMKMDKAQNKNWYLGEDGNAYNDSLKDIEIQPGETKELKLKLTKQMTEENTGVISNKVTILESKNDANSIETKEDNVSTQEMMVLVSTGEITRNMLIIIISICVTGFAVFFTKSNHLIEKFKERIRNYR